MAMTAEGAKLPSIALTIVLLSFSFRKRAADSVIWSNQSFAPQKILA